MSVNLMGQGKVAKMSHLGPKGKVIAVVFCITRSNIEFQSLKLMNVFLVHLCAKYQRYILIFDAKLVERKLGDFHHLPSL